MSTTTFLEGSATRTWGGHQAARCSDELLGRYRQILEEQRLSWTEHHRLIRLLGSGGQGVVYLTERRGTDSFTLPVALKIFSPERYEDERSYDEAMGRMAQVAARVAQIQQDNLLDVHNWVDRSRIRMMEMEWVDGYDLSRLLTRKMLERLETRVSSKRWNYINQVIVTAGPMQPRVKPGIAIAIVRDCLAALAALHREGIVHGDLKPSNIMLKRTGNAKIVDLGSAFDLEQVAGAADLHAHLRRPRSARRRRKLAPQRPGQPGLRADRDAGRLAAVRRADELPRPVGGEAVLGPAAAAHPAQRSGVQRAADELLPRPDRPRPDAPFPQRRGGRPGEGRRRQLPSPAHQGRSGQRVRQRNPPLAGRAAGDGLGIISRRRGDARLRDGILAVGAGQQRRGRSIVSLSTSGANSCSQLSISS